MIALALALFVQPPVEVAPPPRLRFVEPPLRTKLPEDHEYQRVLRKHLATLTEKDFTHGVTAPLSVTPADENVDAQYRNFLLTFMQQPLIGSKRGYPAVNAPPKLFLLANIESKDGVMHPPVWPETLIPFVQWSHPGNPYRDNRALKLRAFVTAAVMMIMLDDYFEANPVAGRADRFAYQLVYFGLPYPGFKDVLPADVQKAYEAGLKRAGELVMSWGIRGDDVHNDLHAPFGLSLVARAINDPAFTRAVENYSRPLFTDPKWFSPAGYWTNRGGPDLGFNGHANFFAVSTALTSDWPFAKDAVARSYRLRSHLLLPEPDGKFSGPSHFNTRLGGSCAVDQWEWNGARDTAAAMVTDEAAWLARRPTDMELREAAGKRAAHFAGNIGENGVDPKGGFVKNEDIGMFPWKPRVWMTYNFPASVNPAYEFYRPGEFARRRGMEKAGSPMLKSPFERGESFTRNFNDEFIVARQLDFAAILHAGPVGEKGPDDDYRYSIGPRGFGGGQLSAFWTPATGSVLLGQRAGMSNEKSLDRFDDWRKWPIHAVSGVTTDGTVFTSARIRKPQTHIVEDQGVVTSVRASGTIPQVILKQNGAIVGKHDYSRTFDIQEKSVSVSTMLRGDGKDRIAELYEVLPVYLRDTRDQPMAKPTVIEFQVGGKWIAATTEFSEAVQTVRLTRFKGAAVITFDRPRRVKLSPADWEDPFLGRGSARNVLIDLLENRTVSYRIEPVSP